VNPSRSLRKGEVAPYLDMANVPTNTARANEIIEREFGSGTKFKNGDTLLARITPCLENGKTAFVDFLNDGQIGWGSTEFIVLRPKSLLPPEFGYLLARDEAFRTFAISNMTGTSGRQRVPSDCFSNYVMAVPPQGVADAFGRQAAAIMQKIKGNDEESRTLATQRDALLPKLLSGELRPPSIPPIS
jgi:type I restriction enzyme S subunit